MPELAPPSRASFALSVARQAWLHVLRCFRRINAVSPHRRAVLTGCMALPCCLGLSVGRCWTYKAALHFWARSAAAIGCAWLLSQTGQWCTLGRLICLQMFAYASVFDQNVARWNTASVSNMYTVCSLPSHACMRAWLPLGGASSQESWCGVYCISVLGSHASAHKSV